MIVLGALVGLVLGLVSIAGVRVVCACGFGVAGLVFVGVYCLCLFVI